MTKISKADILNNFDPNAPGIPGKLFGLPYEPEHSDIVIIPVPWEVTVSYLEGTALGPQSILKASSQLDLFSTEITNIWHLGTCMLPVPEDILIESKKLRALALSHISKIEQGENDDSLKPAVQKINEGCESLAIYVKNTALKFLNDEKIVGVLGGDHSTPLGLLRALSEKYDRFGILQIDAHADLRKAYEGFTYSHASIMFNALKLPSVGRLVQVGIRDLCEEEAKVMERAMGRVKTFFDRDLRERFLNGERWGKLCEDIVKELPEYVYVSFDIDGLDPRLCPHTGTPVPGGLDFDQAVILLKCLVKSGRKIIGFDLCEVAPGPTEWDANVGARIVRELCNWTAVSRGLLKTRN